MSNPIDPAQDKLVKKTASYLGDAPETDFLSDSVLEAIALVDRHCQAAPDSVPALIRDRAIVKVAAELYEQQNAPSGVRNFADMEGVTPVRVARDPMVAARPLLAPFLPLAV